VSRLVLDESALLALILGERGADEVDPYIPEAAISAVNLAEVVAKLVDAEISDDAVRLAIDDLDLDVVGFDGEMAFQSGLLRKKTRRLGLSLGDRACLALAKREGLPALTADRAWGGLDIGVEIRVVRDV
jgi:PIN domain nuclease of toxin-antitoxin system